MIIKSDKNRMQALSKRKRHPIWKNPITGELFEMSYHSSEEVKIGTLKSIIKASGIKI